MKLDESYKAKWCPFARTSVVENSRCKGPGCMLFITEPLSNTVTKILDIDATGYCGLSNKR